ncbi:hypothetical protein [Staphylococcus warneri]|uniref:hypothetical protein n=1 Tax=Staphylococcus warneri TaxID=1292 RepID=UPI0032612225
MSKITKILIGILIVLFVAYLSVNIYGQYQSNIKYDKTADEFEQENKKKGKTIDKLESELSDKESLIDRHSKDSMNKEEKQIRDTTKKFITLLLEQKPKTNFTDKKDDMKPLITEKYYKSLFDEKSKAKYNLYGDSEVENVNVYMDEFKPENDKYTVFVEFEEKQTDIEDGNKEVKKQGSAKVTLERTKNKWFVSKFERFALDPTNS